MKVKLTTADYFYSDGEHKDALEKIGFTFEPTDGVGKWVGAKTRPSSWTIKGSPEVEINTLEDVLALSESVGDIVISPDREWIIYDGYLE